jgi:hypothetical protein
MSNLTSMDQPFLWSIALLSAAWGRFGELRGLTWNKVPRLSLPQYCSCGKIIHWDDVSYDEEIPSGGEEVHKGMASLYVEGH